jgi:ketosteroid isomerase-like protein
MHRRPPPAVLMASPDDVEAQFYEALQQGDLARLMAVWGDDDEIVCVHPGGPRVVGAAAISQAFEAIFSNGVIPVMPEQVHRIQAAGMAVHHLVEKITVASAEGTQVAWVLATNVYFKTAQGWRMVAHHASPAALAPQAQAPLHGAADPNTPPTVLH